MIFYFIGITGVGKSTAGKKVARKMGFSFIDLDALIEMRNSMRINEIFSYGEECFRLTETKALLSVNRYTKHVVATGGGIVEKNRNIEIMRKNGIIVLLKRPIDDIYKGMSFQHRPMLRNNPERFWQIYEKRKLLYEKAADLTYHLKGNPFDIDQISKDLCLYVKGEKIIDRLIK